VNGQASVRCEGVNDVDEVSDIAQVSGLFQVNYAPDWGMDNR